MKNSQLSTTESKKEKLTKQKTSKGRESQIWRSFGGLSAGKRNGERGGKWAGIEKRNWQVQNRQEGVKNSIGNREAKEFI